jgi:hypothetical protein
MQRGAIVLTAQTEWGVTDEQGKITPCASEQAARQLAADTGGHAAYRRIWLTDWA